MDATPTVISLEFNELTLPLIHKFWDQGHLPNFRKFFAESHCFTTDAEENGESLNPWVQWVTFHTGLSFANHQVFRLNEADRVRGRQVWDLLSDAGFRTWVCGSMNTSYTHKFDGALIPDPWTSNTPATPADFQPYVDFVRRQVQEHTNERKDNSIIDSARFLQFLATHGLSAGTIWSIASQHISEFNGGGSWKRASLLDRIQFDLFSWYFRRYRPAFSTFFLNSTAHYQHAFWRHMDPEPFSIRPSQEERTEFGDAVLHGYQQMDKLLGKFVRLGAGNATIILSSGLSQQPCTIYEETGGKRFYRPHDMERFLAFAGIDSYERYSPVMSEQYHIYFQNEESRNRASRKLENLQVDGRPVMGVRNEGATGIFMGCCVFDALPDSATIVSEREEAPFHQLFYSAGTLKGGMHHPEGFCWIRTSQREHVAYAEPVPLRAIAPTILSAFGVDVPASITADPLPVNALVGPYRANRATAPSYLEAD